MRLKSLDRLRGHPLLSLITSERGPFRALKMRPVRQVLLLAQHASENAPRTPGACFWHRISLPYRKSLFLVPNARH